VGRDTLGKPASATFDAFQFTRPAWGATEMAAEDIKYLEVSIHAPRVGRDSWQN